jgi:hypothetical protein
MQAWLTNATKKRVIQEIRKILYGHPLYRADSDNVQNKYAFDERPQRGVIINGTSADRVRLSADNYMGRVSSFVMQAPVGNSPGTTVEWVRENTFLMEKFSRKRDVFPSPPGVYILEVQSLPDDGRKIPGQFTIDPILTVPNEPLIVFSSDADGEAQLTRENIYPGSVRLWLEGRRPLLDGVDFSVNDETGVVTFLKSTPVGMTIFADYRYQIERQGPFPFQREAANLTAIPGAIIAFGDRAQECDKLAIVVSDGRSDASEVYGGKFEVNFDLTVFSRDSEDREKMSDFIVVSVLERQNRLGFEGLELLDVSPGGESEEVYVPEIDDYYYDGAVSLGIRVDWEVYVPLPIEVFRVEQTSKEEEQEKGYLDGTVPRDLLQAGGDPSALAGVSLVLGHDLQYERIL